jgi:hypothetical protein
LLDDDSKKIIRARVDVHRAAQVYGSKAIL